MKSVLFLGIFAPLVLALPISRQQVQDVVLSLPNHIANLIQSPVDIPTENEQLPKPLDDGNFDSVTAGMLTLVEFYTPFSYLSNKFSPEWTRAYHGIHNINGVDVRLRQVNCIENGDLCGREEIMSYPNLVLYAPLKNKAGKLVKGKSMKVGSFPTRTVYSAENLENFLIKAIADYSP